MIPAGSTTIDESAQARQAGNLQFSECAFAREEYAATAGVVPSSTRAQFVDRLQGTPGLLMAMRKKRR